MLCRNPKFGVLIPLGMVELRIPFWVTLTLKSTSGLISRFFRVWSISHTLQLTVLKCVLCLTNSFGGIRHVTVTILVSVLSHNFVTNGWNFM